MQTWSLQMILVQEKHHTPLQLQLPYPLYPWGHYRQRKQPSQSSCTKNCLRNTFSNLFLYIGEVSKLLSENGYQWKTNQQFQEKVGTIWMSRLTQTMSSK